MLCLAENRTVGAPFGCEVLGKAGLFKELKFQKPRMVESQFSKLSSHYAAQHRIWDLISEVLYMIALRIN